MASLFAPLPALADDSTSSPIAHGVLANNPIAKVFETSPIVELPNVMLQTLDGEVAIRDILKGRTVLMPVWAEWCVPCLVEIPDFARLQEVYGKDKFAILPVLSGPQKQVTPAVIAQMFKSLNASALTPMMEAGFGDKLMKRMAQRGFNLMLPCNLLINPKGRVVARELGIASNGVNVEGDPSNHYYRAEAAAAGTVQSLWGTAAGDEFAVVMASGFLD